MNLANGKVVIVLEVTIYAALKKSPRRTDLFGIVVILVYSSSVARFLAMRGNGKWERYLIISPRVGRGLGRDTENVENMKIYFTLSLPSQPPFYFFRIRLPCYQKQYGLKTQQSTLPTTLENGKLNGLHLVYFCSFVRCREGIISVLWRNPCALVLLLFLAIRALVWMVL